jgi:hypothetical protein
MSKIKKYFYWIFTFLLILSTSSCEDMEVCDKFEEKKIPSLELNFKNFETSNLQILKDNQLISVSLTNSKAILNLNFPQTSTIIEIKYKINSNNEDNPQEKEISSKIKIITKPYYIDLACGFILIHKKWKEISRNDKLTIKETPEEKNDENKENENKSDKEDEEKIKLKLALDISFVSS